MLWTLFIHNVLSVELQESGFIYSVGKKMFLSLDMDHIRLLPRHQMPEPFMIEKRGGSDSYKIRLMPSPKQEDKVIDKDWWTNNHRLILHKATEWESEKFTFALLPKNMIKIVVKEKCIVAEDSGYVQATDCSDTDNQLYRWIPEKNKGVVEEFVERHGGIVYYRRRKPNGDDNKNGSRDYDEDSEFMTPHRVRPYEGIMRDDSDYRPPRRNHRHDEFRRDHGYDEFSHGFDDDIKRDHRYDEFRRDHGYDDFKRDHGYYDRRDYYDDDDDFKRDHRHGNHRHGNHRYDADPLITHGKNHTRDYNHNIRNEDYDDDSDVYNKLIKRRGPRSPEKYIEDDQDDLYFKSKTGSIDKMNDGNYKKKRINDQKSSNYIEEDDLCMGNVFCNPHSRKNNKSVKSPQKDVCDELLDSIEKVMCDINTMPSFLM